MMLPVAGSVLKVHDPFSRALVETLSGCSRTRTYLTYTTGKDYRVGPPAAPIAEIEDLTAEALLLFSHNGYTAEEMTDHFHRGATWFGLRLEGQIRSACFVFQNHERMWEVAGVYTPPQYRRMGYAKSVVQAAIRKLTDTGRVPRYQFRDDNIGSRGVAEALRLQHVLTVNHYVTPTT